MELEGTPKYSSLVLSFSIETPTYRPVCFRVGTPFVVVLKPEILIFGG